MKKDKENNKEIIKKKFQEFNKNEFKTTEVLFLIVVTAIISFIIGYIINSSNTKKSSLDKNLNEIINNYHYIIDNYYDEIDKEKLVSGAVNGMIDSLGDDYSQLLEEDSNSTFYISLEGSYDRIGIEIYNDDKSNIVVLGVLENSPAQQAGLKAGDIISQIDDKSLENSNISALTKYIKENKKDSYELTIIRDGNQMNFQLKKNKITIKSIASKVIEKENKKIGYIYISIFSNSTIEQFETALKSLEKQNIDSLIIDVRENTGGHLTTAVSLLSNFLDSKHVIYQIEKDNKTTKYYSKGKVQKKYPIVVLQNENSASASELLSAALKEEYGATIVGKTSFGKGTVQEVVSLSNGDTYKFTTKKWLTPKGNWIHKKGIAPDIEVNLSEKYQENPVEENDNQLQAAIDHLLKES